MKNKIQYVDDDKKRKQENTLIEKCFKNLTPHQFWLLEHAITAFWHGFGYSNTKGLVIPKKFVEDYKYPDDKTAKHVVISSEHIQKMLDDYIKWLKGYQKKWNNDDMHDCYPANFEKFMKGESIHPSRRTILVMLSLIASMRSK